LDIDDELLDDETAGLGLEEPEPLAPQPDAIDGFELDDEDETLVEASAVEDEDVLEIQSGVTEFSPDESEGSSTTAPKVSVASGVIEEEHEAEEEPEPSGAETDPTAMVGLDELSEDELAAAPPFPEGDSDVSVRSGVSEVHFGKAPPARTTSEPTDEKTESGETEINFESGSESKEEPESTDSFSEPTPAGLDDLDALLASAVPSRRDAATAMAPPPAGPREDSPPEAVTPPTPDAPVVASGESYVGPPPEAEPVDEEHAHEPSSEPATEPGGADFADDDDDVDLTDEVEEIAFFLEQNLEDEAREQLDALLAIYGSRPELLELQAQLEGSDEPEPPTQAPPAASEGDAGQENGRRSTLTEEDEGIASVDVSTDLAADIDELAAGDDFQVAFQDVFEEFKKGVAEVVEEGDYQTHYDLGIAYKEMGLYGDAIREFEHASRSDDKAIGALTMMGLCSLATGDTAQALSHFLRGLNSDQVTAEEALALRFEIGQAYEQMGRNREAVKFFEKVDSIDPEFRGVTQRLETVRAAIDEQGESDYEELDGELDELLVETEAERAARDKGDKISYI
ncbi:MAG: tetratricopeptide repeat protein, partial [Myxococcota bacterium]